MNFPDFRLKFIKKDVIGFPHQVPDNPMVSVCVQTFNQSKYISSCLESILMQKTNFSIEILLGEDDSNDGTREICVSYAKKYPGRIKLFLHDRENNIKINGSNTGLFNSLFNLFSAKGKYIAYCDGDDYWNDPYKLQKQVEFLERNKNYVLSYHKAKFVDPDGTEIKDNEVLNFPNRDFSSLELKKALVQPIISTWCFRNQIKSIPLEMTKSMNADNFWISLLGHYGEGKYLPEIEASHYRIHRDGIWSLIRKDKQLLSKAITYENMSLYYRKQKDNNLSLFFKTRSHNYFKMLILYNLKRLEFIKAFQIACRSIKP